LDRAAVSDAPDLFSFLVSLLKLLDRIDMSGPLSGGDLDLGDTRFQLRKCRAQDALKIVDAGATGQAVY